MNVSLFFLKFGLRGSWRANEDTDISINADYRT